MEPRPPVTLTYRDLVHRDEPVPQRDRVREMFGDTVTLTRSVLLRAADAGLDVHWLALNMLCDFPRHVPFDDRAPSFVRAEFDRAMAPAYDEFTRAKASAKADFERAVALARVDLNRAMAAEFVRATVLYDDADFDRALALARAAVDRATVPLHADFQRSVTAARAEYSRVKAFAQAGLSVAAALALTDLFHLPDE